MYVNKHCLMLLSDMSFRYSFSAVDCVAFSAINIEKNILFWWLFYWNTLKKDNMFIMKLVIIFFLQCRLIEYLLYCKFVHLYCRNNIYIYIYFHIIDNYKSYSSECKKFDFKCWSAWHCFWNILQNKLIKKILITTYFYLLK